MKVAFLIADGMGDYPIEELGGKTPLEYANTPVMDLLARDAEVGLCSTIPENMEPGSDIANMALLGFDPARHHTGRGPIEAAALNVNLEDDDIVFRMNLCTVSSLSHDGRMIDYSAGHITTEEGQNLVQKIKDKLENHVFRFVRGFQYRHLLIMKGARGTLAEKLEISPPHDILGSSISRDIEEFSRCPELWELILSAHHILSSYRGSTKANTIWPWGQGRRLFLPDFFDTYGMKGAVISAVDLIKGLGYASNMEVIEVEGATGLLDTNYEGKARAAIEFLEKGDFVFVHLEGPDECSHAGKVWDKIEAIERFDRYVVAPISEYIREKGGICVICPDHLTPIVERTHVKDPVPFLFFNTEMDVQGTVSFSEKMAGLTGIFIPRGEELLPYVLSQVRER